MDTYEQKYKEALKVIESLYNVVKYQSSSDALLTSQTIEKAFPELRESEDEKMIKSIKEAVEYYWSDDTQAKNSVIDWLEKQGERKEATCVAEIIDQLTEKEQEILFKELEMQKEQKPAWSEEDEEMKRTIISNIFILKGLYTRPEKQTDYNNMIEWLKSLKPQTHWKPSEEQMEALNALNNTAEISYPEQADLLIDLYNDLKKL